MLPNSCRTFIAIQGFIILVQIPTILFLRHCTCMTCTATDMAQQQPPHKEFYYQVVELIKAKPLGVGSYGAVCKAMCDQLPCAAKVLHRTLFQFNDPGSTTVMRQFKQECQFLSSVRHPHIVQYLGVSRDPESGLPVLLMELMDSSLTQFLEQSKEPPPYHIQVDLCHDVALALVYLHANGIIHRDLSSNNVLLIGPGNRAKVTDFGMSKLADANPRLTPMTMCPGTLVYMPPEALKEPPVYSKMLDCFSFGALSVQIMTRQFPDPGVRFKTIDITDPRIPSGTVDVPVPEVERRQSQIDQVDPAHPLLPVALDCLKDRDRERPSAQELCNRLAALKEAPRYNESVQQEQRTTTGREGEQIEELQAEDREREVEELHQQLIQQIENLHQQIQEKDRVIETTQRQLQEKDSTVVTHEAHVGQLNHMLEESEQVTAEFQHRLIVSEAEVNNLEQSLASKDQQIRELSRGCGQAPTSLTRSIILPPLTQTKAETQQQSGELKQLDQHQTPTQGGRPGARREFQLNWRKSGQTPFEVEAPSSTVEGYIAHFLPTSCDVYHYNCEEQTWSSLPSCPHSHSSLAVVNGLLTAIGGGFFEPTNHLFSLTNGKVWVKHFPAMPTKRYGTAAVCSGRSLVVAGGYGEEHRLLTVEVMDTESLQWSTASSLPFALRFASATACQGRIYLMGFGMWRERRSMLACSLAVLLQSLRSQSLGARLKRAVVPPWHHVADPPVQYSHCVTVCGQLLTVGGVDGSMKCTTAIHCYNPVTNSWKVVSNMPTARCSCLVTVLPSNELMVVGGRSEDRITDLVEIAAIEQLHHEVHYCHSLLQPSDQLLEGRQQHADRAV